MDELSRRLVPDELWTLVEPLIPTPTRRPQGGGKPRLDNRAVFTAIVFVLTSRSAWQHLPPHFGVTTPTEHRRFIEWTEAGLWYRLQQASLQVNDPDVHDWTRSILSFARGRARNQTL